MTTPKISKDFEAVILNSYEHNGEKKWKRALIGKLIPYNNGGDGFTLYIPDGLAISGRVRIQPKLERADAEPSHDAC